MSKAVRIQNRQYDNNNSVQNKLTQDDINKLLDDYEEISNNDELNIGMDIRYFQIVTKGNINQKLFRFGGKIINIDLKKGYIILTNGKVNWSVQLQNVIIYKKISIEEIKTLYENDLDTKDMKIQNYKLKIDALKKKISELQERGDKYKKNLIEVGVLLEKKNQSK